jgi:hypothetical protein
MSLIKLLLPKAKFPMKENVHYRLTDGEGNVKLLFSENMLGRFLLREFRKIVKQPIDPVTSQVKPGLFNHLAAYGVRVPFLTGSWVDELVISNLITNTGMAGVASRINGHGSEAAFTYIAIGTGATAAAAADSALQAETTTNGGARAAGTVGRETTAQTNDTANLVKTFAITGSLAITESGVLNAASVGILLNRQVFSAVNLVNTDNFQVTHKFQVAQGA